MNPNPAHINEPVQKEFLSVIKEYERVIYKVCYLYTTRNATLGDLYQEVILNLWKAYPKFRKECKISTWIYRIALNTCISFIRKEKNVPEIVALTREADWMTEEKDELTEMLARTVPDDQSIGTTGQIDRTALPGRKKLRGNSRNHRTDCDQCSH